MGVIVVDCLDLGEVDGMGWLVELVLRWSTE